MPFEKLLAERRVHPHRAAPEEIEHLLLLAERDIRNARVMMGQDWDWGFAMAYNAVLQASRAYIYSRGFRPASQEAHKNTFAFMREALADEHGDLLGYFDRMRTKRNRAIYDTAGLITEQEARNLLRQAVDFVKLIRGMM
jgi:uncharacterized protein (UPF0332 family)